MNIEFEQLELQNFKSVGDLLVINYNQLSGFNYVFGTNNDNPGSRNGSGKTSVLVDGITFALFGKTLKNTNNQYIPNRNCDKKLESYAKLTFKVDGQYYRSECRIPGCCQMTLLKYNEEIGEWEDITQSTVIKTRQYIQEHVLGCSFDIFKSAVIVSASDCINFYEGMNKNAKRNYVENIFNLSCFGDMFSNIKTDINDTKKELSYTNNEIIKSTQQLTTLTKKFQDYEKTLQSDMANAKKCLQEKVVKIDELKVKIQALEDSIQDTSSTSAELNEILVNERELNASKAKLEREIDKAHYKIETIQKTIEEITAIKEGLCNDCVSIVDTRYDYEKQIKSIDALKLLINKNQEQISNVEKDHANIQNKKTSLEQIMKVVSEKENGLYRAKVSLQSSIDDAKRDALKYKTMKEQSVNPFTELIEQTNKSLSTLKEQMLNYSKNIKHLEILREVCSENGVKRIVIKDIVKLLNSLIQKYLNEIGADYLVYFDESFDFKFITLNGECEYSSFSAGERKRIQIATILAFRDLIINGRLNSNILVLDEILDEAIDSTAIRNIISILKRKSSESRQTMFIISHRSETMEENVFDHIIEVIKENGVSQLQIN